MLNFTGNKWSSWTLRWVEERGIFHRSNLTEREAKKEFELLMLQKPLKAELIEVTHFEEIRDTYADSIKADNNKRMLEEMQRNNKAVKQLCLLLGV